MRLSDNASREGSCSNKFAYSLTLMSGADERSCRLLRSRSRSRGKLKELSKNVPRLRAWVGWLPLNVAHTRVVLAVSNRIRGCPQRYDCEVVLPHEPGDLHSAPMGGEPWSR